MVSFNSIKLKRHIVVDFHDMNDDLKDLFKNSDVLLKEHQYAGSNHYRLHIKNCTLGRGMVKFMMLKYGDKVIYTNLTEVEEDEDLGV